MGKTDFRVRNSGKLQQENPIVVLNTQMLSYLLNKCSSKSCERKLLITKACRNDHLELSRCFTLVSPEQIGQHKGFLYHSAKTTQSKVSGLDLVFAGKKNFTPNLGAQERSTNERQKEGFSDISVTVSKNFKDSRGARNGMQSEPQASALGTEKYLLSTSSHTWCQYLYDEQQPASQKLGLHPASKDLQELVHLEIEC